MYAGATAGAHRAPPLFIAGRSSVSLSVAAGVRAARFAAYYSLDTGASASGEYTERTAAAAADFMAGDRAAAVKATFGAAAIAPPQAPPPSLLSGRRGEHEVASRTSSTSLAHALEDAWDAHVTVKDVLLPDEPFVADDPYPSTRELAPDVIGISRMGIVTDPDGRVIDWPWETGPTGARHTGGKRRVHRLDSVVQRGLFASTADGSMGANTTGVRKWRAFCAAEGTCTGRPLDPNSPLRVKLEEEWLCMRFVAALVQDGGVLPNTAAGYFGQVQGWHAKEHGVKLAAGMKLSRLPAMLKGLRRVVGEGGRAVRRGIAPQALRRAMDLCLDPSDIEHANIRAALTLALQGLLRGAEYTVDGRFDMRRDLTRADIVSLSEDRLVVMMRPCKNMHHLSGKTVPLIIGAGGSFIDAVAEMKNLLIVDPVPAANAASTPMFRTGRLAHERKPLRTDDVRSFTRVLMASIGEDASQFGAHSYRIGGATALFAAGADPTVIRTMGRWSSDIYRLYVRACFAQTIEWSKRAGSQRVHDVAQEFAEVDSY